MPTQFLRGRLALVHIETARPRARLIEDRQKSLIEIGFERAIRHFLTNDFRPHEVVDLGLATDRPLLQRVLGSTYPGLDEKGWAKLTRNWAAFFAVMAVLNELVWRNSTTNFWVGFKLWGALPLTFLFAAANIPMLLRHGLMKEDAVPAEPGPVE